MRSYSDGWSVTKPHLARTAFASLRTEMPSTRTSPWLGARMPPMIRLAVVLPAPLGPRSATISPGWTWNETSSSASVPSNRRVSWRTSITLRAYERYELAFVEGGRRTLASRAHGDGARPLLHGGRALGTLSRPPQLRSDARLSRRGRHCRDRVDRAGRARARSPGVCGAAARGAPHPVRIRSRARDAARRVARPRPRSPRPVRGPRFRRVVHRGARDPGHHHGMTTDVAPPIDERPDTTPAALQALRGDFLYFNVAGSGPTFPVAQRSAERFRTWLNEVGMFGHVGYAAYNAALETTRADLAAALGDPEGSARVALAQSATDGLNTLIAGRAIPARSVILTTLEEHGSALYPLRRRAELGDELREIRWHRDPDRFLEEIRGGIRDGARALVISLVSCKSGDVLPVREACRIARDAGAISIVDAAQALGQMRVDVDNLGADAVVTLGHKWLHGPLATGGFWVRDLALFAPTRLGWRSRLELPTGSRDYNPNATRFETGTVDAAAFVGLRQTLVVLEPKGGDVAALVQRMWDEERIVVKLIDEPGIAQAIRLSFWALHKEKDIDRLTAAFARTLAVGVR